MKNTKSILAIIENLDLLQKLKIYFEHQKYTFHGYSTSADGIFDIYKLDHIPDIILLDLPDKEDYNVADMIHNDKHLALIPILFFFDPSSPHHGKDLFSMGAADFIEKPINTKQMMDLIHKHEKTRKKWWDTFHIQGPEKREDVLHALKEARYAHTDLDHKEQIEEEHSDDFQHFKTFLIKKSKIDEEHLRNINTCTCDEVYSLGEALYLNSQTTAKYMGEFLKLEHVDNLYSFNFSAGLIPLQFCRKNLIIPLKDHFSRLYVAVSNPFKMEVVDIINRLFKSYRLIIAAPEIIKEALEPGFQDNQQFKDWQSNPLNKNDHSPYGVSKSHLSQEALNKAHAEARQILPHHPPPINVQITEPHPIFPTREDLLPHEKIESEAENTFYCRENNSLQKDPAIPVGEQLEGLADTIKPDFEDISASQKIKQESRTAAEMEKRLFQAYKAYRDQKIDDETTETAMALQNMLEDGDPEVAPIIHLVNSLIEKAHLMEASDIHIEPWESEVLIRYRVDGVMKVVHRLKPQAILKPIIARLKIMSNLDISEKRLPQDGRIRFIEYSPSHDVDIRLSIVPLNFGEKAVLRLLDRNRTITDLETMGFSEESIKIYRQKINSPYGMILHVGPTGSGKTSTLYAALNEINDSEINIQTIEHPIEYTLPGVNQLEINYEIGLDFPKALRSYLRQDPDVILVGEIRDNETAHIAVEAAMTGHLLLSTLHTNDAASTIIRLLEMGIKPYMITSSLLMICAQRLLRRLCTYCKEPYAADENVKVLMELPLENQYTLFKPIGCEQCEYVGYKGRVGIYEVLIPNEAIRETMNKPGVTSVQIKKVATTHKMKTLFQDAIEKVLKGITSLEEMTLKIIPDE